MVAGTVAAETAGEGLVVGMVAAETAAAARAVADWVGVEVAAVAG